MITIDGEVFDVPIASMTRKAEFLDKYAERTEDGVLHRELIGVYFNYQIKFGNTTNVTEYARLWQKLTEPVESHEVVVLDEEGEYPFTAYFSGVGDELRRQKDSRVFWKSLTVNFIAMEPART